MRSRSTGIFALTLLGFYYLFRNRDQVKQFLDRQGIQVPLDTEHLTSNIRTGASKVVDRVRSKIGGGTQNDLGQGSKIRQVG